MTDDVAAPITIGGKELIVQGHPDTQPQYKTYYYGYGDTVFRLGYNGDNFDEQMAALVSQLPLESRCRSGVAAGLLVDLLEPLDEALDAAFFGEDALHRVRSAAEDGPERRVEEEHRLAAQRAIGPAGLEEHHRRVVMP